MLNDSPASSIVPVNVIDENSNQNIVEDSLSSNKFSQAGIQIGTRNLKPVVLRKAYVETELI